MTARRMAVMRLAAPALIGPALIGFLTVAAPAGARAADDGYAATTPGIAAGVMKAGAMTVRLEKFLEMRDGTVQAELSFRNDSSDTVSLALNIRHNDAIGELLGGKGPSMARLSNGSGARYRLAAMSPLGDAQAPGDWISVAPGESVSLTTNFAPDGAVRGVQPFALSLPVRMTWRPDNMSTARTSAFDINFGGLHRDADEAPPTLMSNARIQPVSLQPAQTPVVTPQVAPPQTPAAAFVDDLAPLVARMPAARPDSHRYLFAIGVDQYDDAPNVPFADRSAKLMSELLKKRYGVPDDNMTVITGADATGMKILGRLNTLLQRLTPGDTVYFYYAGHGLAARDGSEVYMVPKDAGPGAYEVEELSLATLVHRFEDSPAAHVVAFLDTCFSGRIGQHESLFPGVAPLIPEPAAVAPPSSSGKTTLFLAGQDFQFANDYPEHGHRLFSYFLMRGLLDGKTDAASLENFVAQEVRRVSAKRGAEFVQEPQLRGAALSLAAPSPAATGPQQRRVY